MKKSRTCASGAVAATYQNKLYELFHSVKLIEWPRFQENGRYVWEVKTKEECDAEPQPLGYMQGRGAS
jgi:hypothetical protein